MPSDDSMVCSRGARPIPPGAGLDHCDDYAGIDAVIPPWPCRCFPGSFISDACLSAGSPPCSAIRCLRLLSHRPSQIPLTLSLSLPSILLSSIYPFSCSVFHRFTFPRSCSPLVLVLWCLIPACPAPKAAAKKKEPASNSLSPSLTSHSSEPSIFICILSPYIAPRLHHAASDL